MAPNPANMCVGCLRSQVDITDGIPKQIILHQCRGCLRYLRPPWVACELESKELLAICLKKVTGLNKVKLIDAGFIWTEPHSRRVKVKLTIQKDVLAGVKLQQVFAVEFLLQNQQCDACQRSYTDHTWRAQVQVRQRVDHKKTFFLLEQLILKYNAHEKCTGVEQVPTGIDFTFGEKSHAMKFIDFVSAVIPTRTKSAKQLISEDIHLSLKNFKFTFAVEVVPLCKDDLVVLPRATSGALGNINPVSIVYRVSSNVYLVDPRTLQMSEMNADRYWREPFRALMSSAALEEYIVLDVLPVTVAPITGAALRRKQQGRGAGSGGGSSAGSVRGGGSGGRVSGGASVAGSYAGGGNRLAGGKRKGQSGAMDDDFADGGSVAADSGVVGGGMGGGFTGAVSLAGGSVHFNGAMSVATTVTGGPQGKLLLADAEVVRARDFGVSDARFIVRTHLGNVLRAGDTVMGYDLSNAVYNDADADGSGLASSGAALGRGKGKAGREVELPDVVLVRKVRGKSRVLAAREEEEFAAVGRPGKKGAASSSGAGAGAGAGSGDADADEGMTAAPAVSSKPRQRVWKLKRLDDALPVKHSDVVRRGDEEKAAADYEAFLEEIESDPSLRKGINLYKNAAAVEERRRAAGAAALASATATSPLSLGGKGSAKKAGAGAGAGAAASSSSSSSKAAAAAAEDEEDEEDDEEEEDEDENAIKLAELLDELVITPSGTAGGAPTYTLASTLAARGGADAPSAAEDPDDVAALAAARAARAAASTGGAGWGGSEEPPEPSFGAVPGEEEDDDDVDESALGRSGTLPPIAEGKRRGAKGKAGAGAAASSSSSAAAAGAEEDDEDEEEL
jgi:NMD protein affecting ribosome stability and mRNA decay